MKRRTQHGIALVITLIMLSVITVMAVAFLYITRRERTAVTGSTEELDAVEAANAGNERARAEIISLVMADTNWMAVDLTVSQNFINTNGFFPGPSFPTNVNYDYKYGGGPLSRDDFMANLTNLWIDPRVPVFIDTNRLGSTGPPDFRFFVDLNRNGRFDTNGYFVPYDNRGQPVQNAAPEFHVGDLEWIGILERPHLPHSSSNKFVGRYAFIVIPIGKTLDLNFIHNDAKQTMGNRAAPGNGNGFHRNQGFGTWEINLAGFLGQLNTNAWPIEPGQPFTYFYNTNVLPTARSSGHAFDDATELLSFRYNKSYQNLFRADALLQPIIWSRFNADGIDGYANTTNAPYGHALGLGSDVDDNPTVYWPGACNTPTNHYFTIHDLFRPPNPSDPYYTNFTARLSNVCQRASSYDQYTVSRLFAQLGTDSAAEPEYAQLNRLGDKLGAGNPASFPAEPIGRININWDNIVDDDPNNRAPALARDWDPLKFFTNTAIVLLKAEGIQTNSIYIPVWPTNYYTPGIHRLLQLAANLYDATDTNAFPSVFWPVVTKDPRYPDVYAITGYRYDTDEANIQSYLNANTFGIPTVIGAKKGIPNFNEYVTQTAVLAARKLELRRPSTNAPPNETNQMFILGISNYFAVEAWNSYSNAVSTNLPVNDLTMTVGSVVGLTVTNSDNLFYSTNYIFSSVTNILAQNWAGFDSRRVLGGFVTPISTNVTLLTNSVYRMDPPSLQPIPNVPVGYSAYERNKGFPVPQWIMTVSNRLTFVLASAGRILDFVYFDRITNILNLTESLMDPNPNNVSQAGPGVIGACWSTNRFGGAPQTATNVPTEGIIMQLEISAGNQSVGGDWSAFNFGGTSPKAGEIDSFRAFLRLQTTGTNSTNLIVQAPFTPARKLLQTVSWQANDPLVHHMLDHLKDITNNAKTSFLKPLFSLPSTGLNTNAVNDRYRPWNGNPAKQGSTQNSHPNDVNHAVKDPAVFGSDDWDFPHQKLPNIGWLGRIHRGTPWQTVYLKAEVADDASWLKQFLDMRSHPTNDWKLIDMFTVAPHPNATRGQLSINQTNIAAWAAVLSGVFVLTNLPLDTENQAFYAQWRGVRTNLIDGVIEPSSQAVLDIVNGINRVRDQMPGKTFRHLGDILRVPELSIGHLYDTNGVPTNQVFSPYLTRVNPEDRTYGLNDIAYERIPEQILSLLKVGDPRYVIYAFGQSLKPADRSIITAYANHPEWIGMCTNYQITGEVVTRSVVRLDGPILKPKAVIEAFNILPND